MTKVHSISEKLNPFTTFETSLRNDSICDEIEAEYFKKILESSIRNQSFGNILRNNLNVNENPNSFKYIFCDALRARCEVGEDWQHIHRGIEMKKFCPAFVETQ